MTRKRIILAAAAAAVVMAVVLAGGAAAVLAQGPQPGPHGERFLRIATVVLDLTDTQQTQIRSILDQNLATAQPLLDQLRQTHQAFEQAVDSNQTSDATLQPLANQLGQEVAQLAIIKARAVAQMHAVLTPEQRARAERIHDRLRGRFHEQWLQH